ncbi:MAG TPA: co-chaperone GroES [Candidatus Paceibacterota bacterium]|nr:co-chaperone GroES [Candidatus Paceibacterota bacterium]
MNLRPLSNNLIIQPLDDEKTTKSGIVLPDNATEKPTKGKVIAAGAGKRNEKGEVMPMSVKVGDIVLFKKYGLDEIEMDGVKYLIGGEEDVLAVIE